MILTNSYLPTQDCEGDYWEILIDTDTNEVTVSFWPSEEADYDQADRVYDIPWNITEIKFHGSYTYILTEISEIYQFKFEDDGCLVADIFESDKHSPIDEGEFKDTFACFDFYNDI